MNPKLVKENHSISLIINTICMFLFLGTYTYKITKSNLLQKITPNYLPMNYPDV